MPYTKLTDLEVTGTLKVDGSAVLPGGGGGGTPVGRYRLLDAGTPETLPDDKQTPGILVVECDTVHAGTEEDPYPVLYIGAFEGILYVSGECHIDIDTDEGGTMGPLTLSYGKAYLVVWPVEDATSPDVKVLN